MRNRMTSAVALVGGVLAALGCRNTKEVVGGAGPGISGAGTVARLDAGRAFAEPVTAKNLTVWPIVGEPSGDLGEFLTLEEAQGRGLVVVSEVGADPGAVLGQASSGSAAESIGSAQVNRLEIENRGDLPILVCGGTVVKGGQQDRQIGQDFVIGPKTRVPVDAFCVEAGRWTNLREGQGTGGLMLALSSIAPKDVRYGAVFSNSQQVVWDNVHTVNVGFNKSPETGTLFAALEETDSGALAFRDDLKKAVRAHFQACRDRGSAAIGFAYAVDGKPVTVRTFAHPRLLDGQFESFLNAMCMEADLAHRTAAAAGKENAATPASVEDILKMVNAINQANEEVSPTSAANRNGVRRSSAGGNLNCYLEAAPLAKGEESAEAKKALIPITQDWTGK